MQTFAFREWLRNHYLQLNGSRLAPGTQISGASLNWVGKSRGDFEV
jgi:hypothetical protein